MEEGFTMVHPAVAFDVDHHVWFDLTVVLSLAKSLDQCLEVQVLPAVILVQVGHSVEEVGQVFAVHH